MADSSFPWAARFIEIVEKSLRRMHHDFLLWNVGTAERSDRFRKLNQGVGIELADERFVCATITQEAIGSSLFSGDYVFETNRWKSGTRYWLTNREQFYITSNEAGNRIKCDLIVNKYEIVDQDIIPSRIPVYIEAKRARRHTANDIALTAFTENAYEFEEIKDDIKRLQKEKKEIEKENVDRKKKGDELHVYDTIHPYILVWGIFMSDFKEENKNLGPDKFIEKLAQTGILLTKREQRWVPVSSKISENGLPYTDKWLWIILVEVS